MAREQKAVGATAPRHGSWRRKHMDLLGNSMSFNRWCLSLLSTATMAYKQQGFTSHFSKDWEVQDHSIYGVSVYWDPFPGSQTAIFSWCPQMAGRGGALGGSFVRAQIPFLRAPPSCPITSRRPHLPIPTPWGLGFNIWLLGGHQRSVYGSWYH